MKSEVYIQTVCDGRYHACCITDVDCFSYCEMPCPYDMSQPPCDMCDITCNKEVKANCTALKVYVNKRKSKEVTKMKEEKIKYPCVNGVCYDCKYCYCLDGKDLRCNKVSGIKCKQVRGCTSFKHKNLFNDC